MKKRILSVFLILCMVLTLAPVAFAVDVDESPTDGVQTVDARTASTNENTPNEDAQDGDASKSGEETEIQIKSNEELANAISQQKKGQTWILAAGEYALGNVQLTQPVNIVGAGADKTTLVGSVIFGNGGWNDGGGEDAAKEITWKGVTLKAPAGENANHQGLCWSTGVESYVLNVQDCVFDGWKYAIGVNSGATGNTLTVSDTEFVNTFCAISVKATNTLDAGEGVTTPEGCFAVQKFGGESQVNDYYYTVLDAETNTGAVAGSDITAPSTWPAAAAIGSRYYDSIQGAINAASSGDDILIFDGEHVENISVPANKVLTLKGQSHDAVIKFNTNDKNENGTRKNAVTVSSKTYYPVVCAQSNLTLKNLTIAGPTSEHHGIDGIYATAGLTMEDVVVRDIRCTADGGQVCGVQYGVGVTVTGSGDVTIKNCEFIDFQKQAISLNTDGTQVIQDNLIQGVGPQGIIGQNGIGIWAGSATITGNTIKNMEYTAENEWKHCSYGVYVYGEGTSVTLSGNIMQDIDNGLYADTKNGVEADIGDNVYTGGALLNGEWRSVASAFFKASNGDTIELNEDVTGPLVIDKSIILSGNGHTVTGGIQVTAADVTLEDVNAEAEGAALTVDSREGKITVTGGDYTSTTDAGQGAGALRIFAKDVTVTGVAATGGIHVFNSTSRTITGNTVGFSYTGSTPFVGILLYFDTLPAELDAESTANVLMQSNQISVPNTGSDYAQVAYSGEGKWEFPGQIPANDSIAKIGSSYYKTLQDAVDAIADNGTITLVQGSDEDVSVSRVVTFTIQAGDSAPYTGRISAGNGYRVTESDGTYTVVEYTASGGGGSTTYTISVNSGSNGAVTVSPKSAGKGDTVTISIKADSGYALDTLTVTDKNGDELKLTDKGNGEYTFTMPAGKVTVKASFAKAGANFTDVPSGAYYADAVAWAVEKGITQGISDTSFGPDLSCTRGQMMTFLWRAAGSPEVTGSNPFTDLQADAYYYDAVLWAVEQGITRGTSETTFSPDAAVTRGQTVTFLYRGAGSPAVSGSSFDDVAADAYYADAVAWAVAEGITNGMGDNAFCPEADCTRAQIVTFLWRDMA